MTTPAHGATPAPSGPFDRLVRWTLDLDGDIYGDERERLRWYEAIAIAASFQWLAVPWTLAVAVWFVPAEAVWALQGVLIAFWVPLLLMTYYVHRRRVRPAPVRGRKAVLVATLSGLPVVVFVAGLATDAGSRPLADAWPPVVGALVGGVLGVLGFRALGRRGRHEAAEDAD